MQKLILLLFLNGAFISAQAQVSVESDSTFWRYAEIWSSPGGLLRSPGVEIYYGENTTDWIRPPEVPIDPKTGKPVRFSSKIDALNFMSALGWEFVQSYTTVFAEQPTTTYIIRRREARQGKKQ